MDGIDQNLPKAAAKAAKTALEKAAQDTTTKSLLTDEIGLITATKRAVYVRALLLTGDPQKSAIIANLDANETRECEKSTPFKKRILQAADDIRLFCFERMMTFMASRNEDIALRATDKMLDRVEQYCKEQTAPVETMDLFQVIEKLESNPLGKLFRPMVAQPTYHERVDDDDEETRG